MNGLGKELIPIEFKGFDINGARFYRPEASATGFVAQVGVTVGCTDEDALPWLDDFHAAIAWPVTLGCSAEERLEQRGLSAVHCVHFRHLNEPLATQMLRHVLAGGHIGQVVGKPFTAEHSAGCTLERALLTFQHQHVISLASGVENAGYHRN